MIGGVSFQSIYAAWFGIWGAAVGSFLNVVIFRIPNGYHVGLPSRSACMSCKRKLPWFENIPVLSYLLLRARCSGCGAPISPRYPMVELLTAMMFVAIFKYFGGTFETIYYCGFAAALIAVTFIDLDHRIIPDVISIPGVFVGLAGSFGVPGLTFLSSLIGALVGGGIFWGMGWLYERVTGREGMGMGDVKLLAMIGAFLGPKGVLGTVVISSLLGSVAGLILMVVQKKDLKLAIPYGPFLSLGALSYLFWGDYFIMRLYPQLGNV